MSNSPVEDVNAVNHSTQIAQLLAPDALFTVSTSLDYKEKQAGR